MADQEVKPTKLTANSLWVPVAWVGTIGVAVVGMVITATAWAVQLDAKITVSANAIDRIAREMEQRPTAREINLQWETLGRMNPDLQLPPLLQVDDR